MKKGEILKLGFIASVAAIISYLVAGALFNSPEKRATKVPTIDKINISLPDIKNESSYQSFLNPGALDSTQPIKIGDTKNTNPFQ